MVNTNMDISALYMAIFAVKGENVTRSNIDQYANMNASLEVISSTMMNDTTTTFPESNEYFVKAMYTGLLGRDADDAGLAYWINDLETGVMTRDVMAAAFVNAVNTDTTSDDYASLVAKTETVTTMLETGDSAYLTTGLDVVSGTMYNDSYTADMNGSSNTFTTGDRIDGGAGTDSLFADMNDAGTVTSVRTNSVENFTARVQADGFDSGENNTTTTTGAVTIDAERMVGTDKYTSEESRADLIIEDVRIDDDQITKDITVAMVSTDPGDVDYGLYFDIASLRAAPAVVSGAVINLEIMDTRSADAGQDPLLENPYNGFTFTMDGVVKTIQSDAIDAATTYAQLLTAVQDELATDSTLSNVTASLSGNFTAKDTVSGNTLTGQTLTLTNSGNETMGTGGWTAAGALPASSGLHTNQNISAPSTAGFLVTSDIILDDVGSGSNGGDLVVGAMSTGDTSSSTGVQEFDITVERSSILGTINSTNNSLEKVVIVNGTTQGDLTVNGNNSASTNELPGDTTQDNAFGFSDVKDFDASAMVGKVNVTAELTDAVVAKYMDLKDTAVSTADNDAFVYTMGTSDDTIAMTISGSNFDSLGTTTREDFTLDINGAAGDDTITTTVTSMTASGYVNSKTNANLSVDGGTGNDTITTSGAGDFVITAGSGNDTVYADNSATKATWVLNGGAATALSDIDGSSIDADGTTAGSQSSVFLVDGKLTVTFDDNKGTDDANGLISGYEVTVDLENGTDYTTTVAEINQAVKTAVNNDAVLSKLLVAQDGPANSLIVTSLIDGTMADANLDIVVASAYDHTTAAATTVSTVNAAYQTYMSDSTAAFANAVNTTSITGLNTVDGMGAGTANNVVTGADSVVEGDNTITGGTGDDVIVLGTSAFAADTVVFDESFGNDTIVNFSLAEDILDFTGILTDINSASGSTVSEQRIATTSSVEAAASIDLTSNEVAIVNDFAQTSATSETWATMTAANIDAALTNALGAGADNYGNIAFGATTDATSQTTQTSMLMVENDLNQGEYKVFEVTETIATNAYDVTLVGTVDFGESIDATTVVA